MDSQASIQEAIHQGAANDRYMLRGPDLQTQAEREAASDAAPPIAAVLAQLPGLGLAYRVLKDWQEEFSPRVYGHQAVLVKREAPVEVPAGGTQRINQEQRNRS